MVDGRRSQLRIKLKYSETANNSEGLESFSENLQISDNNIHLSVFLSVTPVLHIQLQTTPGMDRSIEKSGISR